MSDDYTDFNANVTELVARWPKKRPTSWRKLPFLVRMRWRRYERERKRVERTLRRQRLEKYRRKTRVCACGYVIKDRGVVCEQCRYNMRERVFREALPGEIVRWQGHRYMKTNTHAHRLCRTPKCNRMATTTEFCDEHVPTMTLNATCIEMIDGICTAYDCDCDSHTYKLSLFKHIIPKTIMSTLRRWLRTGAVVVDLQGDTVHFAHARYTTPGSSERAYLPGRGWIYPFHDPSCVRSFRRRYRWRRNCESDPYDEIFRVLVAKRSGRQPREMTVLGR